MTIEFKADYNDFYKICIDQFSKAKKPYKKNLTQLNELIKAMDGSIFTNQIHSEVNYLCADLGNNLSDIRSYVKTNFKEERIQSNFSAISNAIPKFQVKYNKLYMNPRFYTKSAMEVLNIYLMEVNNITRFFVFDNEKLMKIYNKYIGDSIKRSIDKSLKKNPYIWAAFITGIFSITSTLILIFS